MTNDGKLHDTPQFARTPEKLLHDTNITDGAKVLFAHMVWRYGSNQKNYEGRGSMAKYLGVSVVTITKRIKELEAHDWIVVVERTTADGTNLTPFYHVFLSRTAARKFRMEYQQQTGETIRDKSVIEDRKTRRGIGGKPSHQEKSTDTPLNSSLPPVPPKLKLIAPFNSSWLNLYALYLDALNTPLPPKQGDGYPKSFNSWKRPHYQRYCTEHLAGVDKLFELNGYDGRLFGLEDLLDIELKKLVSVDRDLDAAGVKPEEYSDLLAFIREGWQHAPISVMPQHVTKWRQSNAKPVEAKPDEPKPAREMSAYELQIAHHNGVDFEWQ